MLFSFYRSDPARQYGPFRMPDAFSQKLYIFQMILLHEGSFRDEPSCDSAAHNLERLLVIMWDKIEVKEVLLALPLDGRWVTGKCCHKDTLMALLDEGSPLIEENEQPERGPGVEWKVRLTALGMAAADAISRPDILRGKA